MPEIKHLLHINAPVSVVYKAITEEEGLKAWWTRQTIAKPEIGSIADFKFGDRYHDKMRVTNLVENKRIEWVCIAGDSEWIGTKFIFDLESKDNKTILRFTHGDWRETTDFFASCNYHWGYYLRSIKLLCETGSGTPFDV